MKAKRRTLAKQIRRTKDPEVAGFGRKLSDLERDADLYLYFSQKESFDRICLEDCTSSFFENFLKAIDSRNGRDLRQLAKFIEGWPHTSQDPYRKRILEWDKPATLRQWAKRILWTGEDWPLRRMLRELGRTIKRTIKPHKRA